RRVPYAARARARGGRDRRPRPPCDGRPRHDLRAGRRRPLARPLIPSYLRSTKMLSWLIKRRLAAFERTYGYDASYVRDILDTDRSAFMKFARAAGIGHYRKGLPREARHAAGITAVMMEDCGPCTQLAVTMADQDGVAPVVLKSI